MRLRNRRGRVGLFSADTAMESTCRDLMAKLRRAHARIAALEEKLGDETRARRQAQADAAMYQRELREAAACTTIGKA